MPLQNSGSLDRGKPFREGRIVMGSDGNPVVVDFTMNPTPKTQLSINEEYKKDPHAVYCRLLAENRLEELAQLMKEYGKPKRVVELDEMTIHGASDFEILRKDLEKTKGALAKMTTRINEIIGHAVSAKDDLNDAESTMDGAIDYCKIAE